MRGVGRRWARCGHVARFSSFSSPATTTTAIPDATTTATADARLFVVLMQLALAPPRGLFAALCAVAFESVDVWCGLPGTSSYPCSYSCSYSGFFCFA